MTSQDLRKKNRKTASLIISVCAILALAAFFVRWLIREQPEASGICAAALSLGLFVIGCWRFVPEWLAFWFDRQPDVRTGSEPKHSVLYIVLISAAVEAALFLAVWGVLHIERGGVSLHDAVEFWRCLDSQHYLDITREWYVFGEEYGRTVQLVFLPGYPLAVYPLYRLFNSDICAGMLISFAAFPAACGVFYRLLRLDMPHADAFRAVSFLWLLPGGFFFIAPMSESLFLLLCLLTLYCVRKERFIPAALFGAYAAFTRSLGLMLVAPLVFEWVHALPARKAGQRLRSLIPIAAIPCGFLCYLWINYHVSGNALQFLTYQKNHWGQELGWFFHTASYQTSLLIQNFAEDKELFFGLWLPNVVWLFGTLGLFALTSKRLRASYAVWFISYFMIAVGTTWLLSAPRYLLAMPVVALMLGTLIRKRGFYWLAAGILLPASALYLYAFVMRWQVW